MDNLTNRLFLRSAFEELPRPSNNVLDWPGDSEEQARAIRRLAYMVGDEALSYGQRAWAFDTLEDVARKDIRGHGLEDSAHDAILEIAIAVFTGEVTRPKRGRGRSPDENRTRDERIVRLVAWLVFSEGKSKADAVEFIREVVPRAGGGKLTADYIRRIIKRHGPIEKYRNQILPI